MPAQPKSRPSERMESRRDSLPKKEARRGSCRMTAEYRIEREEAKTKRGRTRKRRVAQHFCPVVTSSRVSIEAGASARARKALQAEH